LFSSYTDRTTENSPVLINVCDGFTLELVPPSPKFQEQLTYDPVEVLVKFTVNGDIPLFIDGVNFACAIFIP
jgi:hypothetical protein